jgi:hypothetical protein
MTMNAPSKTYSAQATQKHADRLALLHEILAEGDIYPGVKIAPRVYAFLSRNKDGTFRATLNDFSHPDNLSRSYEAQISVEGKLVGGSLRVDYFLSRLRDVLNGRKAGVSEEIILDRGLGPDDFIQGEPKILTPSREQVHRELNQLEVEHTSVRDTITSALSDKIDAYVLNLGIVQPTVPVGPIRKGLLSKMEELTLRMAEYDECYPRMDSLPLSFAEYEAKSRRFVLASNRIAEICTQAESLVDTLINPTTSESSSLQTEKLALRRIFSHISEEVSLLNQLVVWKFRPAEGYVPQSGDQIHEVGRARVFLTHPESTNNTTSMAYTATVADRDFEGLGCYFSEHALVFIDPTNQIIHRGPGAWLDVEDHFQEKDSYHLGNRLLKVSSDGAFERAEVISDSGLLLVYSEGLPQRVERLPDTILSRRKTLAEEGLFHAPPLETPVLLQQRIIATLQHSNLPEQRARAASTALLTSPIQETSEPEPGLETLCRKIRTAELPIFIRVCGTLRDRNFDGPLEPRWIKQVDGFLTHGGDVVALANICWCTTPEKLESEDFVEAVASRKYPLLHKDTAQYTEGMSAYLTGRKEIFGEKGRAHPMHPTRLGLRIEESHRSIPKERRLTTGHPIEQDKKSLLKLGALLKKYGCPPVLICYGGKDEDIEEISAAIQAGWQVLLLKGTSRWNLTLENATERVIQQIEEVRGKESTAHPNVHILPREWDVISATLTHLGREAAVKMDEVVAPAPHTTSTNPFMNSIREWATTIETDLAVHAQKVVDALLEESTKDIPSPEMKQYKEVAKIQRSLRKLHTHIEWFLRACQSETIFAKFGVDRGLITPDGAQANFDGVREFISASLPRSHGRSSILRRLSSVERALKSNYAKLSSVSHDPEYPTSFETSMKNRDIVRICEIMEMVNYGLDGLPGALHGFTYGDMSRDRFADFIQKNCAFHTIRVNGEIAGFFLDGPAEFMERFSPTVRAQSDRTGTTGKVIAIALDPRYSDTVPLMYEKLINSVITHQMRGRATQLLARVHPRNIRGMSAHMTRGGFYLSSVADEQVGDLRFISMYLDLEEVIRTGIKPFESKDRDRALRRSISVYLEQLEGRTNENYSWYDSYMDRTQRYRESKDFIDLLEWRLTVWEDKYEDLRLAIANRNTEKITNAAEALKFVLNDEDLQVRPDSFDLLRDVLDGIILSVYDSTTDVEYLNESLNQLKKELLIAIASPTLLSVYKKEMERAVKKVFEKE